MAVAGTDLILHFDGGSKGNPGQGYGSFVLFRDGAERQRRHVEFGPHMTNNEAEYESLIAGLTNSLTWLQAQGLDPAQQTIEIRGDSQLVLSQIRGNWKCHEPRMAALRDRALALLRRFKKYTLAQVPRAMSVKLLGH
jgi:ribonuclease HI